jgi:hypothetical protein
VQGGVDHRALGGREAPGDADDDLVGTAAGLDQSPVEFDQGVAALGDGLGAQRELEGERGPDLRRCAGGQQGPPQVLAGGVGHGMRGRAGGLALGGDRHHGAGAEVHYRVEHGGRREQDIHGGHSRIMPCRTGQTGYVWGS